jgi:hypothetical protein
MSSQWNTWSGTDPPDFLIPNLQSEFRNPQSKARHAAALQEGLELRWRIYEPASLG